MVGRFRRHGLGVIVDVVPNHMAIPVPESLNRQLWSVLREGAESPCAHWFDVDWAAQDGRLLLPILAGPAADCLGDITVCAAGEEPVLRYFDHELPVRPGTAGLPLPDLLGAQHYRLTGWRDAATGLNWRRFFDITSLIAVRVEDPGVFAATHRVLLRLTAEGLIDGLRVDHPDGLADPRGYLERLAAETGDAWVVTEKILSGDERLPADWACAGTTGTTRLAAAGGLFVDPAGAAPLTEEYQASPAAPRSSRRWPGPPNGRWPAARSRPRCRGWPGCSAAPATPRWTGLAPADLSAVLTELLAAFPVYRAYVVPGEPPPPRGRRRRGAGRRVGPAAAPRAPARRARRRLRPGARPRRGRQRPAPADRGVPADLRPGDGQGRGGHRVLPLDAADRAERGRRRPGPLRGRPRGVPRLRRPSRPATGRPP